MQDLKSRKLTDYNCSLHSFRSYHCYGCTDYFLLSPFTGHLTTAAFAVDRYVKEDARFNAQKMERKARNDERRTERKERLDEIRRKYGEFVSGNGGSPAKVGLAVT